MDVKFIKTTADQLDNLPIVNGQLIVLTDESGCYYDMNNTRYPISSSGGGHVIEDADGTDMTQRANLQFTGYLSASDDSTNDRTIISAAPTTVTWDAWNQMSSAEKEGTLWQISDVPGQLPSDIAIFILTNQTLTFTNLVATISDTRITAGCYPLVYWSDATYSAAQAAGVTAATSAGQITFTATTAPSTNLVCDVVFINAAFADRNSASNVSYDNTSSGLTATNVQAAIDEVYGIVTSNDSVSVTGDGVATYTSKLDALFALIDPSKINERSILKMGNEVYHTSNIGGSDYQFIGTTISIADGIGGRRIIIKNSGSNFFRNLKGTTYDDSNQALANGSVIKVIY